ncbi:MAG: hypothetical protein F4Y48_04540, partial [Gammaproteobacteria bacterium]|nr:hypothetical protein [Gammaproteobacteria bacterium]
RGGGGGRRGAGRGGARDGGSGGGGPDLPRAGGGVQPAAGDSRGRGVDPVLRLRGRRGEAVAGRQHRAGRVGRGRLRALELLRGRDGDGGG